ncbi:MAG: Ig-like domain repeat protein [Spirochaetales bacterium]|nr:Ig-like domain repeat protein [Spirochaetales bacterium]
MAHATTNPVSDRSSRRAAWRFAALALVAVFALGTCDLFTVGLGSKVDVTAPEVRITSPTQGAYLGGAVTFTGSVADDVGVSGVRLVVSEQATGNVIRTVNASLSEGGFSASIDTADLDDTRFLFTAVATDAQGRSSSFDLVAVVDNHAPTVLVNSPTTYGAAGSPRVSKYIDIRGEAYDSGALASVDVLLLDSGGTVLAEKRALNPASWSISFDFDGADADFLPSGVEVFYYVAVARDAAGNESLYYYHRNDIYGYLDDVTHFPSVAELARINDDESGTVNDLDFSELSSERLYSAGTLADFTYDDSARPEVRYTNLDVSKDETGNVLSVSSPITGLVTPPLGIDIGIDPESLEAEFRALSDDSLILAINIAQNWAMAEIVNLGNSISFKLDPVPALESSAYKIVTRATTLDSVSTGDVVASFTIDSAAPTLDETELGNVVLFSSGDFGLGGYATASAGLDRIEVDLAPEGTPFDEIPETSIALSGTESAWTWNSSDATGYPFADGSWQIRIKVLTITGKATELYRSVVIDTTVPELEIVSFGPLVGGTFANGTLEFSVAATDANGIGGIKYWLLPSGSPEPAWTDPATGTWVSTPYAGVIDTGLLDDLDAYKLWVKARDKSLDDGGLPVNVAVASIAFVVKQSSDLPSLALTPPLKADVDTEPEVNSTNNLFGANARLYGTLSDDDSIDASTIAISFDTTDGTDGTWDSDPLRLSVGADGKSVSFDYDLSGRPESVQYFWVKAWDLASEKLGEAAVERAFGPVWFAIDAANPALAITAPNATGSVHGADFQIQGTASDANGLLGGSVTIKDAMNTAVASPAVAAGLWDWTIPVGTVGEGVHDWTVVAVDRFGKTSSVPFRFTIDLSDPVISISAPVASVDLNPATWSSGTAVTASGSIDESVASIEWSTDGTTYTPMTVSDPWSVSLAIGALGEGPGKTLYIRATDLAGNTGTASRSFGIDQSAPSTSVSAPASASAAFAITGTATDTNALANIRVTQIMDGDPGSEVEAYASALSGTGAAWTTGIVLPIGGVASGTYEYTITITDIAGRTFSATETVLIDLSAPETLTVSAPSAGRTGTNAVSGSALSVGGTALDAGVGLAKLWYLIDGNATAPSGVAGYTELAWTDSTWTFQVDLDIDGAGADLGLAEGKWYLHVKAEDAAGNRTADGDAVTVEFDHDQANPSLAESAIASTGIVNRAVGFSLGGTAADGWGIAAVSVTQDRDGLGAVPVSVNGPSGTTTWALADLPRDPLDIGTQQPLDGSGDGVYTYVVTVTDLAGKTTQLTRIVRFDTTGPSLTVTTPAASEFLETATKTFQGSVNDGAGSGVASVEYSMDSSDGSDGAWFAANVAGTNWNVADVALGAQGAKFAWFRSTDALGNRTLLPRVDFYYDSAPPAIDETAVGTTDEVLTNADVTLSGSASDLNALTNVTVSATKGGVAQGTLHTDAASPDSWTYTHPATLANNGLWVFTITATDAAGRSSSVQRTVRIDTIAPVPSITLPGAGAFVSGSSYTASGGASDANIVAAVEWSIDGATWYSVGSGTTSWSASLDLATIGEGSRTLQVRATDEAGNLSAPVSRPFVVDLNSPTITETSIGSGAIYRNAQFALGGDLADNVDLASISVTQNKNSGGAVAVYSASYAGAVGGTPETGASWSVPALPSGWVGDATDSGVYEFIITVTDASGKTSSLTRTVTVDKTDPALAINSVIPMLPGNIVNGKVTLSANASDENGLDGVKYFIRASAATPAYTDVDGILDAAAPYDTVIDTTALSDGTYYFHVLARDKAGNVSALVATVLVQQSSDLPSVSVDSPADGDAIGTDKKIRGTFSDDDGVAANSALFYWKKSTDASFSSKTITNSSAAGQLVSWTIDLTTELGASGDGTYQYYVRVTDDADAKALLPAVYTELGSAAAPRVFTFDNSPPTVSATLSLSPIKTAYRLDDVVTISWTASDASGIASQVVDVDGSTAALSALRNPSGSDFEIDYTVPATTSGNKSFTVVVTDETGRSTTRTATILVDTELPEVEDALSLDPAFVGSTPNGAFTLRGTASDNRALANVQVSLSGPSGSLAWTDATLVNGNWSFAIADSAVYVAASGDLSVEVRAYDQAGNLGDTRTFVRAVDQAADKPVVSLLSPVGGSSYGTTVQISGTASDDDNLYDLNDDGVVDASAVEVDYWDTATATHTIVNPVVSGSGKSATFNLALNGLAGGDWNVSIRARDDAGTWSDWSATTTFTVNSGAPNLIVSTAVPAYTNNASLALSGTVEDSDGVRYVKVRVNGGAWQLAGGAGLVDTSPVDGEWDTPPTAQVAWSITLNLGSDGLKTLEFEASDGGFIATQQKSTTLDDTAPDGAFDAQFRDDPTGSLLNTSLLNKLVRITGTVTELNLADSNPIEISIDGAAYVPVTGTFVWSHVWDTTSVPDDDYTLALRITDKAGNVTTSISKVVTTSQAADVPVIAQAFNAAPSSGDAGLNILGTTLKVSGTLSDDDGFDTGAVLISLDGGAYSISAVNTAGTVGTWEYTWASLAQSEHFYSVRAIDRNGASFTMGPTYFIVDTANPTLTLDAPLAGAKIKAGTLTISGTASDSGGLGASPLSMTLRHSNAASPLHNATYAPAVAGSAWSQPIAIDGSTLDGTLYIDLVLTDRAGKQSSVTRALTIDTTSPSLNLNYPSVDAYINGLISVTGTADDLSGLADVTLQVLDPASGLPVANVTRSGTTLAAWEFPFNSFTYANATYGVDVNADGKLWRVRFRLAATDNSGNVAELLVDDEDADTDLDDWPSFYVDTDGDKPTIAVTQPKTGDTIGGFVSMFGTATDDDGPVMQVEVQIDFNGDGDYLDARDLDNDGTVQTGTDTSIFSNTVKIGDPAHPWEDESAWYVVSVTNNSWTRELNSDGELYAANTGSLTDGLVNIRVRSRDQFGLASEILTRTITLDQTFPRIENIAPLDQTYQNGVFNLTAEFGDNVDLDLGSVSQVRININKTGYQTLTVGPYVAVTHPYSLVADLADPQNGYDLVYEIDTEDYFPDSSGILYADLYVKDESGYTNQRSFTYYVDNQDPSSAWSDSVTRPDGSNLRNGMITVNGVDKTYVEGNYGDSGAVSGISHIEVYVVKDGEIRNLKADGVWTGATTSEDTTVENYTLATNSWSAPATEAELFVAHDDLGDDYVIRVDRPTEMSDLALGTDLDGDGYHEFQGIYDGKARWRAYFDSADIPDGLADLHYVVYDLAGNRVHRMRQVFFANNGPQIDRIAVGSDLNGSGTVANADGLEEIKDYYNPSTSTFRSDSQKIKNLRLYLGIEGGDPNPLASPGQVKQIFVDVYNAAGTTLLGNAFTSTLNPASGDASTTLVPTPGTAPWTSGYTDGIAAYTLKITVRDSDDINVSQYVKVSVIDPVDATPPVVTLSALSVDDQDLDLGHLELQGDNTLDVWNAIKAAYGGDNDPKVSGAIRIKGVITDDNLVSGIQATSQNNPNPALAAWVDGALVPDTARFVIDSQTLGETGHTVNFTYTWESSEVTGVAGLDKTLAIKAFDGVITGAGTRADTTTIAIPSLGGKTVAVGAPIRVFGGAVPATTTVAAFLPLSGTVTLAGAVPTDNTSASVSLGNTDEDALRVDVVPYVISMDRDATSYNTYRSRLGYTVLRRGEAVTFTGFNLFNSTSDLATFVGQAPTLPAGSTATSFTLPGASTASIASGPVSVTVSGQISINNLNDNTKEWNSEATTSAALDGSTLWNDDIAVHVWQSDDNQTGGNRGYFTGSADPEYPAMSIDGAGLLYGSWSNYASSSILYGTNSAGAATVFTGYDPSEHTDIHFGSRATVAINANLYGNGAWNVTGAGGSYVWDNQATDDNDYTGTPIIGVYNAEALYHDQKLMQFVNQRVVTNGDDIHLSYYDTDTKSLKYWYHQSGVNEPYAQAWINIDGGLDAHDGAATNVTYGTASETDVQTRAPTNGVSVASVAVSLGQKVAQDELLATLSNGTQITATANGYVSYIITVGSAVSRWFDTTIASLASHSVVAVLADAGDTVVTTPTPTPILSISDYAGATTVISANAAGFLGDRAAIGTPVTNATVLASILTTTTRIASVGRSSAAGEYSAVDVVPGTGFPLIAYYDIANQTVKLARASAVNPAGTQWYLQAVMDSGTDANYRYSGKYISMKVDVNGYVHLAFFRNSTGDLVYMRSTNTSYDVGPSVPYTFGPSVVIDSIGSVGTWADLSLDGTNPVISYLDSSLVNTFDGIKLAYYDSALETETGDADGVPDSIDGWETMNAALGYEVESVRTSVETDTGANFWNQAIGYSSTDYYRIGYYVK